MYLRPAFIAILAGLFVSASATGSTMLFDFETPEDVAAWSIRYPDQDQLTLSEAFAVSEGHSLLFATPPWADGKPEWPAFEAQPPVRDWSGYDRLVIHFVNPDDELAILKLYVKDGKHPLQQGGNAQFTLQPKAYCQAIVDLAQFPKGLDMKDIALCHFYTTRPPTEYAIHIDAIQLLAKGESLPLPPASFVQQVADMVFPESAFGDLEAGLERVCGPIRELAKTSADKNIAAWAQGQADSLSADFEHLKEMATGPGADLEGLEEARRARQSLPQRAERLERLVRMVLEEEGAAPFLVGVASSMEKVLPRDVLPTFRTARAYELAAAQGESEGFQVIVLPWARRLEGVRVEAAELMGPGGAALPASALDVRVVGYVKTGAPPYQVDYTGWWPDPLLDFMDEADVEAGDAQALWVRVRVPEDQAPGHYAGQLAVCAAGVEPVDIDLSLTVYGFRVPKHSPLPTAMSVYETVPKRFSADWREAKIAYTDFLADYYIDYDSLYRRGEPDYEILEHLRQQGRLVAFNLGYFSAGDFEPGMTDEAFDAKMDTIMAYLEPAYAWAKERGLLDKAYIYGFDECNKDYFPILQRICEVLGEAFPEVPLLTTTRDHSFGRDSGVTAMDGWTPLTPQYDPAKVAAAREEGKQVWWYICCGPPHPYANWFVEYSAIETRLLMGAMTAKYRPDGFLYYAMTRWPNNDGPIEDGPFTSWNPASYKTFNGDGSIVCPGPGGRPLATIRLENFRDGLEDYAYYRILEETIAAKKARISGEPAGADAAWLAKATALMEVPEDLVKSLSAFGHDPAALYAYRAALAEAIMSAGVPPAAL